MGDENLKHRYLTIQITLKAVKAYHYLYTALTHCRAAMH